MAIFAGVQTGYDEPTMLHESTVDAFTGDPVFAGVAGDAEPVITMTVKRLPGSQAAQPTLGV